MSGHALILLSIVLLAGVESSNLSVAPKETNESQQTTRHLRKRRRLEGTCGSGNVGNGLCADHTLCCSKWGWCGTTSDYCGKKAPVTAEIPKQLPQNQPLPTKKTVRQGTCGGGNVGNKVCANTAQCCSAWGWCGISRDYCGKTLPVHTALATLTTNRPNPTTNHQPSPLPVPMKTQAPQPKGTCGGGRVGNGVCGNAALCCSKWGWCGKSSDHCGIQATATIITPVIPAMTPRPTLSTKKPTQQPIKQPKPAPTKQIQNLQSKGTCGSGIVGNGICADATLCCSKWGYCGTSSDYCVRKATISTAATINNPVVLPITVSIPQPAPAPNSNMQCNSHSDVMTVNFGYYASWSRYRNQDCNKVSPQDINVAGNNYTHLTYAFAGINTTDQLSPWGNDYVDEVPQFVAFNALKKSNPNLKTLISVGGWSFTDPGPTQTLFSDIAASPSRRATFAASVVAFLQTYGFDGIDVDWEYPNKATRGGKPADVQNFPLLLKAIRDASSAAGVNIVISIAVTVDIVALSAGYNLAALAQQVDFFNLMAYDMNGVWNNPAVIGANADLSVIKTSIQYLLQNGVPSNKMVLGLAAYGHTFQLSNPACSTPGCAFTSGGPGGCAGATGVMPYFTIDQYVQSKNYNSLHYNPTTSSMELVTSGNVWVSYDNTYTFNVKASYAAASCLRGIMWWSVDQLASPMVLGASRPKFTH